MTGALADDDLDAAYRAADLLVAPSRTESYGMAIADALARGIPVVASNVGGIPLTVSPDRAAILVPPEPQALSRVLDRWMLDPALRRRLTAEAVRGRAEPSAVERHRRIASQRCLRASDECRGPGRSAGHRPGGTGIAGMSAYAPLWACRCS